MWFLLIPLAGLVAWALSDDDVFELKINSRSENNCSEDFLKFSENLDLPPSKEKQLRKARKVIEEKVKSFFQQKKSTNFLGFYIQGSIKHKTIIRRQNDTCDVDLGVYLSNKPEITPATLQKNIAGLLTDQTIEGTEIRSKCVRVFYANKSHIDLPVYYRDKEQNKFYIAVGTSNKWEEDDPKIFTEWLKKKISDDQILRIIKYLKAWTDKYKLTHARKMPSGLALTIWTLTFFERDTRDDLAFAMTSHKLFTALSKESPSEWICKMPTTPFDNVISKLSEEQRKNFLQALKELLTEVNRIFTLETKQECIQAWQGLFGRFF